MHTSLGFNPKNMNGTFNTRKQLRRAGKNKSLYTIVLCKCNNSCIDPPPLLPRLLPPFIPFFSVPLVCAVEFPHANILVSSLMACITATRNLQLPSSSAMCNLVTYITPPSPASLQLSYVVS
jgi:hypothetical protein